MKLKSSNTVLLVFARSLAEEVRHKPILSKNGLNRFLYQQLNKQLRKTISQTGLPVIWWDSTRQKHRTFAENFKNAFQHAFENFENVIAIGNDCPSLSHRDLLFTAQLLIERKIVLGPAHDGGVYLIAINKNRFDSEYFDQIRWQTSHVLHDICQQPGGKFHLLSAKPDIDSLEDLRLLSRQKMQYAIAMILFLFLQFCLDLKFSYHQSSLSFRPNPYIHLRAPPFFGKSFSCIFNR